MKIRIGERDRSIRQVRDPAGRILMSLLAACLLVVNLFSQAAYAGTPEKFPFVRDFGSVRFAALIPDATARRLIAIENLVDGTNVTLRLHVLNDRLEKLGLIDIEGSASGAGFAQDPVVYALDDRARVLHLVVYPSVRHRESAVDPHLLTIDLSDPGAPNRLSDRSLAAFPSGARPLGMSLNRQNGRQVVYFVGQMPSRTDVTFRTYGALIAEVDLDSAGAIVAASRVAEIPNCQRVIADTKQSVVEPVAGVVWVACGPTSVSENSTPSPAAVLGVDLTDPARSRSYFLPGTYSKGESFFDPNAGELGRLVVAGSAALRPGQAVWVFDIKHRAFVGQFAADEISGVALDTQTGRIFVATGNRVLIGSDRGEPLPQALPPIRTFGSVAGAVTVVPFKRWVIIPSERSVGTPSFYAVYSDRTTNADLPEGSLTDFRVQDSETTPVSAPNFAGNSQAFGARVRIIGGATNIQVNRLGGSKTFWYDPIRGLTPSPRDVTGLEDGDRDVYFARITDAELSADAASAGAVSADRDDRTRIDYRNKVGGWPAAPARCLDFGSGGTTGTGTNESWASGWAAPNVSCDVRSGKTAAHVESEAARIEGVLVIGSSESQVTLMRLATGAVRTVAHAEVRDVTIGGVVHIGRITSDAVVEAFGGRVSKGKRLRGSARATYTRTFEHVSARGASVPGGEFSCGRATETVSAAKGACDITEVVRLLTAVLGTPFQVELPEPDELATRGGAHAHAWRDPWSLIQDSLMNGQLITEAQVPALRISYVADGDVPSRILVDLAATKADATSIAGADEETVIDNVPVPVLPEPDALPSDGTGVTVDDQLDFEPPKAGTGLARVLETGWGFVFGNRAADYALSAFLWGLFAAPPFLALRRRYLRTVARIGMPQ